MRFANEVALVTGAARGIGRVLAERLAQEGADVAVADIRDTLLQDIARAITDLGRRTLALSVDVTDKAQVDQMLRQVVETFGSSNLSASHSLQAMWLTRGLAGSNHHGQSVAIWRALERVEEVSG